MKFITLVFAVFILLINSISAHGQTGQIKFSFFDIVSTETYNLPSTGGTVYGAISYHTQDPSYFLEYANNWLENFEYDNMLHVVDLTTDNYSGTITIKVYPNTSTNMRVFEISGAGSTGIITVNLAGCALPEPEPNPEETLPSGNWVLTRTYTKNDNASRYQDITFYDGLGYPSQVIHVAASANNQKNIVTPIVYDYLYREESKKLLPYVSAENTLVGESNPVSAQQAYYTSLFGSTDGSYAFTSNLYENSPLGRLIATVKAGKEYLSANKKTTFSYATNTASDVYKLTVNGTQLSATYFPANSLLATTTTNEDGNAVTVFKDALGNLILERVENDGNGNKLETYYAYELSGRLSMVLSPVASSGLPTAFTTASATAQDLCYLYTYDSYGRMASKKFPGAQAEEYSYAGTSEQLMQKKQGTQVFTYTYDLYGRVVSEKYKKDNGIEILSAEYQYDNTNNTAGFQPVAGVVASSDNFANCKTLKTYERILILDGTELAAPRYITRRFFYDYQGRIIQIEEQNPLGGISRTSTQYDFVGNVLAVHESHQRGYGATPDTKLTTCTYDARGRLLTERTTLNSGSAATVTYGYDELGKLASKSYGNGMVENFAYTIQGWQNSQTAKLNGSIFYQQQLCYYNPVKGSTPLYSGNISEWSTTHGGQAQNTYGFTYDPLGRLLQSNRYEGASTSPMATFTERGITYDRNGNIAALQRYTSGLADNFTYDYSGNKLTTLSGSVNASYLYDNNGNMTKDGRKNLDISYNLLNLPSVVSQSGSTKATYTYLADGSKVQVADGSGNGFAYLGSLIYTKSGSGYTLESAGFSSGRIQNSSGTLTPYYYTTDHLGSVRLVTNSSGAVAEQNDYFPFGGKHTSGQPYSTLAANRYKFNGKEEQTVGGLSYLDYGARMYDNVLGRWMTQDPLGEKYYGISSYSYCNNNPVAFIDPDGRDWYQSVGGEIMWRKSISDQYVDNYSQIWKNIGETYTHLRKDGSSTFFYQKTNDAGELSLASHTFSANEMAGFGLFHSDNAREAGMLNHVNPTLGTFVNMVAQEMAAQWTDPYLLTAGAAIFMTPVSSSNILGKEISVMNSRVGKNGKALEVIFKDGSKIDINNIRVKEWIPNEHPNAPAGVLQKVKFQHSLPGSKGYKRSPTSREIEFLNKSYKK